MATIPPSWVCSHVQSLNSWWKTSITGAVSSRKKATIHQVTTMLATSKNVLFPGHYHLLTTGADDPSLWISPERQQVKGHQYCRWLWPGNKTVLEVASMVVTWWIVAFLPSVRMQLGVYLTSETCHLIRQTGSQGETFYFLYRYIEGKIQKSPDYTG